MPHYYQPWSEVIKEDETWKKAVNRFIKKGFSEEEIKRQHESWKIEKLQKRFKEEKEKKVRSFYES